MAKQAELRLLGPQYDWRGLIEQHGGAMGAVSTPGAGSAFWFTLPIRPAQALA